ncbi:DUF5786 family protein [Natronorubrum bangense]|uniref:DUF5786 family protein n=1 Tax=Natronorubrum bangense TaxID=61858 RepID=UPI001F0CF5BC|nr:DUF5786 family protein [Natronorubrum bangense]
MNRWRYTLGPENVIHGFGSYDESEQQQQNVSDEDDEDAAVNVHENDYEGEMTVETGDSTDNLIGQLQEIKENKESEEE